MGRRPGAGCPMLTDHAGASETLEHRQKVVSERPQTKRKGPHVVQLWCRPLVVLLACVGGLTVLACAIAFGGFLLSFLPVTTSQLL